MAAQKPRKSRTDDITVVGMMILEDGNIVPVEDLTPGQIERFQGRAAQRLSAAMSGYYTQHPGEYRRLRPLN